MQCPDVNILVYSFREDAVDHGLFKKWLEGLVNGDEAFGMSDLVLGGFLRVVTSPKIFHPPTSIDHALTFVEGIRSSPNCMVVAPGPRHWDIFARLCRTASVKGPMVTDAYLAALAIESGCEWVTMDGDYARFTGLRWRRPF
ncbi:MAG: type II toxin-antitoxin system VapC family toxin [SAR202 cluster bacterium]|nr:type II toxin-antitoxin system VapC family toxin [SAR202 cluster bacterium]